MCTLFVIVMKTLNMISEIILRILFFIENALVMMLQNIFNSINFCCQICSIIPVCCVFIITSKLRCFLSSNSGACSTGHDIGLSCVVMTILTLIVVLYILNATDYLDMMIDRFGYIPKSKPKSQSETTVV